MKKREKGKAKTEGNRKRRKIEGGKEKGKRGEKKDWILTSEMMLPSKTDATPSAVFTDHMRILHNSDISLALTNCE